MWAVPVRLEIEGAKKRGSGGGEAAHGGGRSKWLRPRWKTVSFCFCSSYRQNL